MNESNEAPKSGCLKIGSSFWSIAIATIIILFMAAIAGPKLISSRLVGNEAAAIGTLRFFSASQRLYKEQGHKNFGTLEELQKDAMKGHQLENGVRQGYRFDCQVSKSKPDTVWWATAEPVKPGESGQRYFLINQKGELYYSSGKPVVLNTETGEVTLSEHVHRVH